ncbi:hypothetical protein [Hymenobacter wooponensis]|uniref:Uncharacterized protein n=1 Tax=Hymenobacter wooponensis TaxID=1525360 RepID=A0A4Z0MI53_9BACT|nr:hypothetical protein [Hymenobacter wooponensis]TGD79027.1 hypothetical protein EU557_18835 [Hymenobacter wooponensis]
MSRQSFSPPDPIGRLFRFGLNTVLPAAPAGFWWMIGLGLFSLLNIIFQQEIWPHTPGSEKWCMLLGLVCLLVLPWQIGRTANQVANSLHSIIWQFCWRLAAWSAYVAGGVLLIPGVIGISWLLIAG